MALLKLKLFYIMLIFVNNIVSILLWVELNSYYDNFKI